MNYGDAGMVDGDIGGTHWKKLYNACDRISSIAPWEFFCEIDILEIRMGNGEDRYFCTVSGMFDERKALSVYKGTDGLISLSYYLSMRDAEVDSRIADVRRDCMECSWGRRDRLRSGDRKALKSTGHTYRGAEAWPMFRAYDQGLEPWFLTEEQAGEMAYIMDHVADGIQELLRKHDISEMDSGSRMVREYNQAEERWETHLEEPMTSVDMVTQGCMITDEVLLRRLKKKKMTDRVLELESCYVPLPVKGQREGGRRFYPRICVICDMDTALVEQSTFVDRNGDFIDTVLGMLIGEIESGGRPSEIVVRDTHMYGIINHMCQNIGVPLYISPSLEAVDGYLKNLILSTDGGIV